MSPGSGPGDDGTLLCCLQDWASRKPAGPAIRTRDGELTYGEFYHRILLAATHMRELGVRAGDRVIICLANSLSFPTLYFAAHAVGAIATPVPPDTPDASLESLAADCEPALVVADRTVLARYRAVTPSDLAGATKQLIDPAISSAGAADLLYTTGTTGLKKGVVLTHHAILEAARNITEFVGNSADDVELVPLPLTHSFGLGRLRCLALTGHTLLLEPGMGNGAPVIRRLIADRPTGLAMVPAGFEILRQVTGDTLAKAGSSLRYVEIGSAPMRPSTREWLMAMLPNARICHHYGLTEASRAAFTEYHADRDHPGSVGKASPRVTITICDESGTPAGTGQPGEIVVNGGMLLAEYWKRPELTSQCLCSYGLRTGDSGYLNPEGYLYLLGRRDDLINVGGRKVVPDEVEEAIREYAGVRDAACVAEADAITGEHVKAFVAVTGPLELSDLAAFLRTRIEPYRIPAALEIVDSVPRTGSGKLQRHLLRQIR